MTPPPDRDVRPLVETNCALSVAPPVTDTAEELVAFALSPHCTRLTVAPLLSDTPVMLVLRSCRTQADPEPPGIATARAPTLISPVWNKVTSVRVCDWLTTTSTALVLVV